MTESEWQTSYYPRAILEFLADKMNKRKGLLFAEACCRRMWHLLGDVRSRDAVDLLGRYADGEASDEELGEANGGANEAAEDHGDTGDHGSAVADALHTVYLATSCREVGNVVSLCSWRSEQVIELDAGEKALEAERRRQCEHLRDIFVNPFRPVALDPSCRTPAVDALAQAAYEHRPFPPGHLDPARLAVLSDALEESGCTDAAILSHLRSPGPHVRGCWALDLILGKE